MQKVVFEPGVPQTIALRYRTPKVYDSKFPGGAAQAFYSLVDGRGMYVDFPVAKAIDDLELGNSEEFCICKDKRGRGVNVWLTPEGEKFRAMTDTVDSPLAAELQASLINAHGRNYGAGSRQTPTPPTSINRGQEASARTNNTAPVQAGWALSLLQQTNALVDIYSDACLHADQVGVPHAAVRTLLISAYIGQQKKGHAA